MCEWRLSVVYTFILHMHVYNACPYIIVLLGYGHASAAIYIYIYIYIFIWVCVSWKKFEPFWRNITSKIVMSSKLLPRFRHITWFVSISVSMKARLKNQRGQLAGWVHVKGNIVYLAQGKYYEKNAEPFWRYITSKIVFTCMFLAIYCHERLFAVTDVSMNANRTN